MPRSKRIRAAACWVMVALMLMAGASHDHRPTPLDLAVAPYRYELASWELSHLPDKWLHLAAEALPWSDSRPAGERRIRVQEYFQLGRELQRLEAQIWDERAANPNGGPAAARVRRIREQRRDMQAEVEQTLESEISAVLVNQGLHFWPKLVLPPVDTHFSRPPGVLVLSPRDRILRQKTVVLRPGMTNEEKEGLEQWVLESEDLSALVVEIGGIATYPSNIPESVSLPRALEVVAHEWLHHWFFFRPLGQGFWDSPEMTSLNETAATLGGVELGALTYAAMADEAENPGPAGNRGANPGAVPQRNSPPAGFDAAAAIRETRRRTEELLAQGEILEAEAYMEQRRRLLVDQGYRIRKINQAFFAFRQSYATDPGSTSTIDEELRELRRRSGSLGDFLRTVAGFGNYQEFAQHLELGR